MTMSLVVSWTKCRGQVWADLFAVDLGHRHFDGLTGIYVIWRRGGDKRVMRVGSGPIRQKLEAERCVPELVSLKADGLFVTWSAVPTTLGEGMARYLVEELRPKMACQIPPGQGVHVNLPGVPLQMGQLAPVEAPEHLLPTQGEKTVAPPPQTEKALTPAPQTEKALTPAPQTEKAVTPQASLGPKTFTEAPPAPRAALTMQSAFDEKFTRMTQGSPAEARVARKDDDSLAVRTVQFILEKAVRAGASDIHLEPMQDRLRVRLRIDGILEEGLWIPNSMNIRVVPRIRVMVGLDPEQGSETARPQQGRMVFSIDDQEVDIRLSTLPTNYGEKAVLRIIRRSLRMRQFSELGMTKGMADNVSRLVQRPQGMVVVTGPAGNGKSTTLYAILQILNTPARNIVTLEDPVELVIPGVNQSAVKPAGGFTFASGLKAILRQDPNIIMVGEIRDRETAEIAMSAALTGHLIFSTLHTNSAIGAVTRFLDMGVQPYVAASALTGVMAQRLARRICSHCQESYRAPDEVRAQVARVLKRLGAAYHVEEGMTLYRGKGCPVCRGTGYVGRVLLFELVQLTSTLRQAILDKAPLGALQARTVSEGVVTLFEDGLRKASEGITTLDEVLRMVEVDDSLS